MLNVVLVQLIRPTLAYAQARPTPVLRVHVVESFVEGEGGVVRAQCPGEGRGEMGCGGFGVWGLRVACGEGWVAVVGRFGRHALTRSPIHLPLPLLTLPQHSLVLRVRRLVLRKPRDVLLVGTREVGDLW